MTEHDDDAQPPAPGNAERARIRDEVQVRLARATTTEEHTDG